MITVAAWAATPLKWVLHAQEHTCIIYTEAKDVRRHNPLGAGPEDETAHLFTEFISPVFLASLFMNLSICMTCSTEFGPAAFLPYFSTRQPLCVRLPVWPHKASSLSIRIRLPYANSLPVFFFFLSPTFSFFSLSPYIFVIGPVRFSFFDLLFSL